MRPLSALLVAIFLAAFSAPALHPQAGDVPTDRDAGFWASNGNSLLRHCDETDTSFPTGANARQESILMCDLWVAGMTQGIELTEQIDVDSLRSKVIPPSPALAKAQEEQSKANVDFAKQLKKLGIEPVITPDADMCVPSSVQFDQLRRVIIKWLKDNPTKLDQSAPMLAFAALRNTYSCPNGTTASDWVNKP